MAKQKLPHPKENVIPFPNRIPATFCPENKTHEHDWDSRTNDPTIKRCTWCGLWLFPKGHPIADELIRKGMKFGPEYPKYPE